MYRVSAKFYNKQYIIALFTCANQILSENLVYVHKIIRCGHVDVAKALVELQADVSVKDNAGSTPLHIAARNGHSDVISFLLTQPGINPVSGKLEIMIVHT